MIQAVFVWPPCFVGPNNESWKYVLGQLEIFAQSNWIATRGKDLCGNRDITNSAAPMKYPPEDANSLLSFVYSAKYISKFWCTYEKKQQTTSTEERQPRVRVNAHGSARPGAGPGNAVSRKNQAWVDAYKLQMTDQPRALTLASIPKVPEMMSPEAPAKSL